MVRKALPVHIQALGEQSDRHQQRASQVSPERLLRIFGRNRYLLQFHFQEEPVLGGFPETIHEICHTSRSAYRAA